MSVDVLLKVFEKMDAGMTKDAIQLLDWTDGYNRTLHEAGTMLFSTVRNAERENLFRWLGPIAPHKDVIIALTAGNVQIADPGDLNAYTIGVIKNYSSVQLLTDLGVPPVNLVEVENVETLYAKLVSGDVECIAYSEAGNQLIVQALGYNASDFDVVYTLQVSELYYAFNHNTPDDLMDFFSNAFEKVKLDKTVDGSSEYEKIMNSYGIIGHSDDNISADMCITLVENTCADIATDAQGTFSKINQELAPYKDKNFPALYVFVYDTAVNMIAHADNPLLVGKSFRGKPDVAGHLFRDEIVSKAQSQGDGWVDYIYTKTGEGGLYYKTTYFQLIYGSDAKPYVVCAGRFK